MEPLSTHSDVSICAEAENKSAQPNENPRYRRFWWAGREGADKGSYREQKDPCLLIAVDRRPKSAAYRTAPLLAQELPYVAKTALLLVPNYDSAGFLTDGLGVCCVFYRPLSIRGLNAVG